MIDRRQFLCVAAAGAAMTLARSAGIDHDSAPDPHALAHPELLTALGPEAVREIGQAYRALVPAENDPAMLEAALHAQLRAARSSSEQAARADFAEGRVVVVRDWLLSRTEARQCALFSLLPA
jgi:hypothetical protein